MTAPTLRQLLLATLALLTACENVTLPADVSEFTPPAIYRDWWAMTEACSFQQRDIGEIRWFASAGSELRAPSGDEVGGYYTSSKRRIVLSGDQRLIGELVRHEMLHALLRDVGYHPRREFLERCAGTLICLEQCTREGGAWPAPDPAAVRGTASQLTIRAESRQDTVYQSDSASIFSATILATNNTGRPLLVSLPPSGDAGPPATFSFQVTGTSQTLFYNDRLVNPGAIRFEIGETKRWVVDFRPTDLDRGPNDFTGFYGDAPGSPPIRVMVLP